MVRVNGRRDERMKRQRDEVIVKEWPVCRHVGKLGDDGTER